MENKKKKLRTAISKIKTIVYLEFEAYEGIPKRELTNAEYEFYDDILEAIMKYNRGSVMEGKIHDDGK